MLIRLFRFFWFAENIGTLSAAWLWSKIGSWYLLMIISFVLVSLLHKEKEHPHTHA